MDTRTWMRRNGLPAVAAMAALWLVLALPLGGCGSSNDSATPLGPEDWVNPDVGSTAEPLEVQAADMPYTGEVTGGIHYLVVRGLPPNTPYYVALTGKSADADLFVLGNAALSEYRCSSVHGGAADDQCTAAPAGSDALYVEVYGYTGHETRFILDIW